VTVENEEAVCHSFLKKVEQFDSNAALKRMGEDPETQLPRATEAINQTQAIAKEPPKEEFTKRVIYEFKEMSE